MSKTQFESLQISCRKLCDDISFKMFKPMCVGIVKNRPHQGEVDRASAIKLEFMEIKRLSTNQDVENEFSEKNPMVRTRRFISSKISKIEIKSVDISPVIPPCFGQNACLDGVFGFQERENMID
ncbi:hypothetical protein LWI28_015805 [Acer negundo]|uniref:Uncharacterized protein n=1 Tax=Acer negundo TaxID=4023 RepID=A0AAD5NJJ3_ACENE|nr:hypothetical protein LWI28_015805 [Acer negundo]